MKRFLTAASIVVFCGVSALALVVALFALLRRMIATERVLLQVAAVVVLLALFVAYVTGAVLLAVRLRKRRAKLAGRQA